MNMHFCKRTERKGREGKSLAQCEILFYFWPMDPGAFSVSFNQVLLLAQLG